jgi:3-oxoacyl-[acyl-carrier-protein] synthase II
LKNCPRRVVITGIGVITPIGIGREAMWKGLREGRSGVGPITRFDASPFSCQIAAEVPDFDPLTWMDARKAKRLDRFAQFSLASALMAVRDSGLDLAQEDKESIGIYVGSALGGIAFAENQHEAFLKSGVGAVRPTLAISVFGGASSCNVAMELGVYGPNVANANSCASGVIAVGEAARLVARGECKVMLAGAAEAPLSQLAFGAFSIIRAMSTRNQEPARACRPFDVGRDGFVMGEAAAMLVLEDLEHARARGARVYAEVQGYGTTNDAYSMTAPRPDGSQASRAMRLALEDAECPVASVGYINAHGSSTPLNDGHEAQAINQVKGSLPIPVSATKSMHGHALGASGAVELAICAEIFSRNWLPPTVNVDQLDPECDLDVIPNQGREAKVDRILSNSFGFGGINACCVLGRI